jgi:UDP-N-acetylglucosamine 2-epimerase (non-hydrolysing)
MAPVKVLYVVGARPNFVKMAPVLAALRRRRPRWRHVLVHTGQHYDREMSEIFLADLGVGDADHRLGVGSATPAVQTARIMERLAAVVDAERPSLMIVPGDVNSTLAAALVAARAEVPLAHVEAGLRSFDRSMPEEINRIVTDQLSDLLFVHSDEAVTNLAAEGTAPERVHFVGNTMIDSLVAFSGRIDRSDALDRLGLAPGEYVLVTLHRPALVDGPLLAPAMAALERMAGEVPVVFPMHPRTRAALGHAAPGARVRLLEPLGYVDFLALEARARAVLTDSGGLQEECTYLGVPCFTLRPNTERPVTLRAGTNTLLGQDPAAIDTILPALGRRPPAAPVAPPGWDGSAAERVAGVVEEWSSSLPGERARVAA